jgi:hypothetical protein
MRCHQRVPNFIDSLLLFLQARHALLSTVDAIFLPGLPDVIFYTKNVIFDGFRTENVGISDDNVVFFMAIWNILLRFGIFIPILVYCIMKNLATLLPSRGRKDISGMFFR